MVGVDTAPQTPRGSALGESAAHTGVAGRTRGVCPAGDSSSTAPTAVTFTAVLFSRVTDTFPQCSKSMIQSRYQGMLICVWNRVVNVTFAVYRVWHK